jgi:hypothetical protein
MIEPYEPDIRWHWGAGTTISLCVFMFCAAWVLTTRLRHPDPAPLTVTVSVTRPQDAAPTVRAILPPLEVRR